MIVGDRRRSWGWFWGLRGRGRKRGEKERGFGLSGEMGASRSVNAERARLLPWFSMTTSMQGRSRYVCESFWLEISSAQGGTTDNLGLPLSFLLFYFFLWRSHPRHSISFFSLFPFLSLFLLFPFPLSPFATRSSLFCRSSSKLPPPPPPPHLRSHHIIATPEPKIQSIRSARVCPWKGNGPHEKQKQKYQKNLLPLSEWLKRDYKRCCTG